MGFALSAFCLRIQKLNFFKAPCLERKLKLLPIFP
jgi:hypothetical protein